MAMEIIINAGLEEARVAVLDNKIVTDLLIERKKDRGIVGNVYKGRVTKVLPGMQAAFVDIGVEKAAFLHASEATASLENFSHWMDDENGEHEDDEAADQGAAGPGIDGEVGAGPAPEPSGESAPATPPPRQRRGPRVPIEDVLKEGQEIVVQVSKDPLGTKGPRVTTYVSLPGRHLVMMPTVNHIGISRRIQRADERHRLREIVTRLRRPGVGYIVRTVSEGINEDDLRADTQFLELLWQRILHQREAGPAPALLHTDLDAIFRTIRDVFTDKVSRLVIDSREEHRRILDFMTTYLPHLIDRVERYEKAEPIFDAFAIEVELSRALGRKVWLRSGGYIVIDHAEALTVIDVNTGRYVGKRDLEATILKTNLEAAKEIAYQIHLRNIGGILIIDFIDMEREKDRDAVFTTLQEAMRTDRAKLSLSRISELGLVEMSRERTRENLKSILSEPCVYCDGRGYTKSPTTVCYEIFREILRLGPSTEHKKIIIEVHPAVADLLSDEERRGIEELERLYQKRVIVKANPSLHREEYEIATL